MSERRIESRYLCADLVRLEWLESPDDAELAKQTAEAVLEDISEVGGCVQVDQPIPLGASIQLSLHDARFTGTVCYCVFRDYGFFVGIRFSGDTVWKAEQVLPEHLINLQDLVQQAGH